VIEWVIKGQLARSCRPGYGGERRRNVPQDEVNGWIRAAQEAGIKSIICLLAGDQLNLYNALPTDLVAYYERAGLRVTHIPALDHHSPPLSADDLARVWAAYQELPKPVLIHCSAGIDRTGMAVSHITQRLAKRTRKGR
jgi:protein-tyrosine phosphatase